uniref:Protocadherin Fat 3 n=1 Tax=Strigops habroptila TaxID=2489341 RepID=A0A672TV81_STRHB
MEVNMGRWSGSRPPPSCLALLIVKLLASICQVVHGTTPLGFHFTHSTYNATVYENSAARTYVNSQARMGITLADLSWDIKYRIVSGDDEGFFKAEEVIIADFCFLRIRTKGGNSAILNREIQDNYLLMVKGSVRGEDLEAWTKVNIQVLDMNDLRPLFSPTTYSVTIAESTPLRTSIAQVTATDADIGSNGEFYYYFKNKVDLFSVHPTSGVISLSGRLNYDEKNRYDLEVLAVDRGMKLYGNNGVSSTAKLYVHIERINEHAPTITVVTHIPFPSDKEPTYAVVNIDDLDEGANGEIESVSIVAGDPLEQFFLSKEGKWMNEYKIKERKPIDWDSFPYGYNLTLQAKDKGSPQKFSAVKLVHIASPKKETIPMKFEKEAYDFLISEFSPPGVVVAVVKLISEPQGVEYRLSPSEEAEYFKINPNTGLITTARPLKIIEKDLYELEVYTNKGGDLKAHVTVRLEDANDHTPEFQQPSYSAFVNESVPVGSTVLVVSAVDKDRGENGYITYSIASLNSLPFTINQFTGVISTSEELDFESSPESYRFTVRASDWGSPYRHESEVNVTVYIGNVNDNKPLFEKVACQGVISSDFPVGGHITAVSAIDIDELELVKYKIISGNELGIFYLNPDSGVLQLKKSLINSGIKNSNFGLKITATDGENFADAMFVNISVVHGKVSSKTFSCRETRVAQKLAEKLLKKAKANVKLNLEDAFLDFYSVNRQAPHFDKSFPTDVKVSEDLPVGATILRIKAYDADSGFNGRVLYTISDGNVDSCFNIDMETGVLNVLMPLDREKTELYVLNITIYDLGNPQKSAWGLLTVTVEDANDNKPVFLQDSYSVNILESTSLGTEIIQVEARDKDLGANGEVTYSVLTDTQQFAINSSTGMVYVADQLDRESKSNYTLKIEARDKAESGHQQFSVVPLKVFLDDVNDCSPAFIPSSYNVKVLEDLPVGTVIAWLETHDPDLGLGGQVRYSLVNDYNGRFEIDKASGAIRLNKELDYEKQQFYNLTVRAKDKGRPVSLSSVSFVEVEVVDVNENLYTPYFPDFAVIGSVKENSRIGTSVLQVVARDEDSGRDGEIQYSIRDGSGLGRFSIDEETGEFLISFSLSRGFCTSKKNISGYFTPNPFLLSSERPGFNQAVFTHSKQTQVFTTVMLKALNTYQNRCDVSLFLFLRFSACCFSAGVIYTADILDRETTKSYWLTVYATDHGVVLIKVLDNNDNGPEFSHPSYDVTISEDILPDTEILQIEAIDRDEKHKLSYTIHSSIDTVSMRKFRIDPSTGVLYTAERLDHEAQDKHILNVMVRDQEFPYRRNLARVIINVEDSNDHSPYFTSPLYEASVFESAAVGSAVLQVTALDKDKGENAELIYTIEAGNTGNTFKIEPVLGIITLLKEPDLTTMGQFVLSVKVADQGSPPLSATAIVRISVTMADNSHPKFTLKEYQAEVNENVDIGTSVISLSAISQSTLVYEVKDGNVDGVFTINPYSGVITSQKALDYERASFYQLIIQATNMAGMASNATVNIQIVDENDNPPVFLFSQYSGSISEAAPVNSIVRSASNSPLVIRATDADSNQNALLVYQIVESTAKKYFTVDSSTGAIRTIANLDHETIAHFHFHVHVRDSGNPQLTAESPVEVTIEVTDVNDNPPVFSQAVFETVLLLPTYVGVEVLKVKATDPDSEIPPELTYSLIEGNMEHFSIDSSTGVLTIKNNSLSKDHYMLIVRVSDGKFYSTAMVTIMVKEAMDSGLHFTQNFYSTSISENSTNITKIAVVNAVGNRLNEPLKYSILNPGNKFKIKSTSGVIQTTGIPFDREEQELYELVVEASRELDHIRVARVVVRVYIEDINDNAPVFIGLPYYAAVQVDAEPGTMIYRVTAIDKDKAENGEVSYLLKEDYGHFEIDRGSGSVTLKEAFNSDLSNIEYLVVILAKDGGNPSLSASVELPITIVNKAMPVFDKPFYTASVNEDVEMHTPILSINATSPEGQGIIYIIVDGDPYNQFNIDFDTGVLSVISPLDYEINSLFKLMVRASDALTGARAEVTVDLIINDVNDNPPVFDQTAYNATLSEASLIGTPVLQVVAIDADSDNNKIVQYQIVQDTFNSTDYFHIDSSSGLILTARMLDHELVQQCSLKVRATDNGFPPLSSEVLVSISITDMNDNPPVFNQLIYESYVSELAPRGHFVTCVQASDADSSDFDRLEYSILSGNDRTSFIMDSKSGVITLSNHRKQRMEPMYSLNVSVSDGLFTSTAQVHIQILGANLYSPVFSQSVYVAEVRENAAPGTKVIHVKATDGDSGVYGQISYSIINDFAKDRFLVDSNGQILTTERLDRENPLESDIGIFLRALDGGGRTTFCTVRVIVVDENDNAPQFMTVEYRASVKADVGKGYLVTQVQAVDPDDGANSRITYSLYSEASVSVADLLEIDPDNGWMVTKGSFNQLKNTVLSFFVKAVDGGIPVKHSLIPVYIHVLPPEIILPSFSQPQYSFTIAEDTLIGSTIDILHVLPNQGALYSTVNGELTENNKDGVFIIEQDTGLIKLDKRLDHETNPAFHFKVAATIQLDRVDIVLTVDVEVKVLDVNDNKPMFETASYDAIIMEGMPIGTKLMQVKAVDADSSANGQVTYTLAVESELEKITEAFTIDSNSGWISTLKDLDHEKDPAFTFAVVASDLGEALSLSSTTLVSVTVTDINDNAPIFEHDVYRGSVKESDPPGEVVAVLSTWDEDTSDVNRQVSYHITGGNPKGKFALGLVQNEWKVYVKRPLDREEQDVYYLNITATDGLFVTQAAVEVTVTDVNDNNPVCEQVAYTALFPEDIPSNKVILKISAKDADIGSNGEIRYSLYGPGNSKFLLDPENGELKSLAPLDREKIPAYNLVARATDGGGRFCQSEIHLILEDVNDNPPVFSSDHYTACVYENTATKALLTRVQATDPDVGVNRKVTYSLADSADGYFSVDQSSGIIILEHPLDRELQSSYNISVKASDQSIVLTLSSFATVTITVLDINDNPPVFERRDYLVTVPEDTSPGTEVLSVFATSQDIGTNAEIAYLIRSGNEKGKFRINSKTGVISIFDALDYETCKDFYLVVEAKDGGTPALSAVTTVNVNVTDVNDNAPKFSQAVYSAVISEDAAIGESVIMLIAEDLDSPSNGQIHFSIVNGDRDNEFSVDPALGLVKVKKKLDRERISGYSLVIQARDSGTPPLSSSVTVNVDISDVNDNGPVFTPANYTAVIQENKPVGTSILQLVVTDKDSFHNGPPFTFTILTGNEEEEFTLDPHGVLRSAVIFKHMVATEYVLCVQAKDSGKPQQVSHTYVQVRVIEESIHKPTAIPLEIFIVTMEDDFPGGVIGKIHATDQDVYDVLTYTLKAEQKSLFKVNSHDGKIIALGGLDNGKYVLNVSVSDGRFQVPIDVVVHVEQLLQEMLQNTVTIRFDNVSPEDFVGLHMHGFRRTLRNAVLSQKQDSLHIISIQPVAGSNQLDMLFAVQMHNGGFYKPAYLIQKLTNARRHLENVIRISAILEKNCSGLDCQEQHCEQSLSIDSHSLMAYSTARISFVCPRFYRNVRCMCNGGLCPGSNDPCLEKPCPGDMQCVGYEANRRPFICQCPPGKLGECSGHTSLSFAGNSYIKYRVSENSKKEEFKLALRLRTLQSNGIIMYTRANPCIILKIVDGKLWFQLDCGSGPGILGISGRAVNDGSWHSVFLELNRNFTSLSLDDSYVERRKAPLYFQTLSTDSSIYFGAQVQVDNVRSLTDKRTTQVLSGFQGCLDSVVLNNNELPLQNKRSSFAEVVGLTELKLGCVLYPDACERHPCQNGGTCTSVPSGGYQCNCLSQFTGRNCESEITACFPNPCQNGGSCDPIGNAFICNCKNGLTGVTCEEDIDECEREECENGGSCVNIFGSFLCNCTPGYVGQYCGLRPVVVPNIQAGHSYVGKEELIGIAGVLFVIFVLIILFIIFRKKVFRKNYSRNNITLVQDPATAALLNKSNGIQFKNIRNSGDSRNIYQEVGPPQVPVRPMAYTPCFQSDSRNNLDKIVDGLGVEHQEMTTFHPESPRILTARRGVVVCSVAPNLPAVSPCRSDCDSIRKSTWDTGMESKGVDDAEEVTCFAGSNKGSNSEVQSLSSFQSDSGDDNAYHWDTSDWMPSARLSDIEEVPNFETADGGSAHHGSTRELETDYYLGGYDIDSDYPPPHEEEFLTQDQLPPPLPEDYPDQYETLPPSQPVSMASTLSPDCRRRPHFHPSQYLPPHQFPNETDTTGSQTGNEFSTFAVGPSQNTENVSAGKMPLSLHNSLDASSSDVSASCGFDDSEVAMSDYESVEELNLENVHIPFVETQHQTQV